MNTYIKNYYRNNRHLCEDYDDEEDEEDEDDFTEEKEDEIKQLEDALSAFNDGEGALEDAINEALYALQDCYYSLPNHDDYEYRITRIANKVYNEIADIYGIFADAVEEAKEHL